MREYKLSNTQKKNVIQEVCSVGTNINKIYSKLDSKFELSNDIKKDFNKLSAKLSRIHALITKCLEKKQ